MSRLPAVPRCPSFAPSLLSLAILFGSATPASTWAANGLYTSGFGGASSAMAGTDLAFAEDVSALTTNPAGLAQSQAQRADGYLSAYHTVRLGIDDALGNDRDIDNNVGALAGGGYIRPLRPGLVAGVGLLAQGGLGFVYDDFITPVGNRDDISALFGIFRLTGGLGWQASERLRLGLTLDLNHATVREKFFPNTSAADPANPAASFFGLRADGISGTRAGTRVGLQYRLSETLLLGAAYAPRIPIPMKGGSVTVNYESVGAGRVRYNDVRLDGLALPQELGLGLSWSGTGVEGLTLGLEASWFEWSRSLGGLTMTAKSPDRPAPVDRLVVPSRIDGRNKVAYSGALVYTATPRTTLRAGYCYTGQIQPDDSMSPIFALLARRDYALGLSYAFDHGWTLFSGLEYQPYTMRRYTNPDLPAFGSDNKAIDNGAYLHLMLSRRW